MKEKEGSQDVDRVLSGYFGGVFLDDLSEEGKNYLKKQIESLNQIEELEDEARSHAYELLTIQDKESIDYKYSPSEVLGFIKDEWSCS